MRRTNSTVRVRKAFLAALAFAIVVTGLGGLAIARDQDKLSKFLLLKLSRDQSQVLCTASAFTSCMGFTEEACLELSEKALQQCIVPLPDTISLQELDNDVLEACPQEVYADAGFSEDKAAQCLQQAFDK